MNELKELQLLREIEELLRSNQDTLLKRLQPDNCGCVEGKPKLVYNGPSAYKIGMALEILHNERLQSNRSGN